MTRAMKFATEAALCAHFAARAEREGWDVYAETGGYDLLLVRRERCTQWRVPAGAQVGIQAKLRPSLGLVEQLLRDRGKPADADRRAALVPEWHRDLYRLLRHVEMALLTVDVGDDERVRGSIASATIGPAWREPWDRATLPPIKPTFGGGHPCPRVLSGWRVSALRVFAALRAGLEITSDDFVAVGLKRSAAAEWHRRGWLTRVDRGRYVLGPCAGSEPAPDVGYEAERDALAARGLDRVERSDDKEAGRRDDDKEAAGAPGGSAHRPRENHA